MRGQQPIPGATARTYRLRAADRGRRIRCRITATNASGASTTRTTPSVLVSRR